MNINFLDEKKEENEPVVADTPETSSPLKNFLVNYVGEKKNPEQDEVTVSLIVETVAEEFPEFLMLVAQENWIRGYQQALNDVAFGEKLVKEEESSDEEL